MFLKKSTIVLAVLASLSSCGAETKSSSGSNLQQESVSPEEANLSAGSSSNMQSPHDNCNIMGTWAHGPCQVSSQTDRYTFVVNYPFGHTCMVKFESNKDHMNYLKDKLEFYNGFDFSGNGGRVNAKLSLTGTSKYLLGDTGTEHFYMAFFTLKTKSGESLDKVIADTLVPAEGAATITISGIDCRP